MPLSDPEAPASGRLAWIPPLPVFFWLLAYAASGMTWVMSGKEGSGGDPAGNGMSTGIIGLLSYASAGIIGVLALIFIVFKGFGVRMVLASLLALLAGLLFFLVTPIVN